MRLSILSQLATTSVTALLVASLKTWTPSCRSSATACRPRSLSRHCVRFLAMLLPIVLGLTQDRYYKLTSEALRVCSEICKVLRPDPPNVEFEFRALSCRGPWLSTHREEDGRRSRHGAL